MDLLELYKLLYAISYVAGRRAVQLIKEGRSQEAAAWLIQELDRARDKCVQEDPQYR